MQCYKACRVQAADCPLKTCVSHMNRCRPFRLFGCRIALHWQRVNVGQLFKVRLEDGETSRIAGPVQRDQQFLHGLVEGMR